MNQSVFDQKKIEEIKKEISDIVKRNIEDPKLSQNLSLALLSYITPIITQNEIKSNLDILFEYEKHYLGLMKEFKEELKFSNSIQEDLRRERSQFFTQILGEVYNTMEKSKVDPKISNVWIQELVSSYTNSIDLSSGLANSHLVEITDKMKKETEHEVKSGKKINSDEAK